ncbi:MAG: EamA family transporter RarD [Desulfosarcinaceae bacterium]|nr:EamA family transporter RarD [Desulfosarcinaceae bacterium]
MKPDPQTPITVIEPPSGILASAAAFLIWGLSPAYWKCLAHVPATEIILHRIVWSFLLMIPLLALQRRWREFTGALRRPATLGMLSISALLVGGNWFIYIWAVNNEHILEASLGYYINPLVNVFLGMLFLRERLRRAQVLALLLAASGVLYVTLSYGAFPWVALSLALSFGFYGLIRKVAPVASLPGLAVETLILALPAGWLLLSLQRTGAGSFLHSGPATDLLLAGTAPLTAVPLLLFTLGARKITLTTLGFIQYLGPTGMFLLGVWAYGEAFTHVQGITFGLIWTALAVFTTDMVLQHRKRQAAVHEGR